MGDGSVKYKKSNMAFVQMENLEKFVKACQNYGMKPDDCFQVVNLYEHQNPWSVVCTLYALGRKVSIAFCKFELFSSFKSQGVNECSTWVEPHKT